MGNRWSIPLFRVAGIRLELHLTFLLLLLFLGWQGATDFGAHGHSAWRGALWLISIGLGLFACVILHELGHSLSAMRYGVQTRRILLLPIGGMAQMESMPRQPGKEFLITIAGPAVNFVIAALLLAILISQQQLHLTTAGYLFHHYNTTWIGYLNQLMVLNLVMGTFNLIPVYPMDGGRLLRSLLALKFNYLDATRYSVWVARPLALLGSAVMFLWVGSPLGGLLFLFIFFAGDMEYRQIRQEDELQGIQLGDIAVRSFRTLPGEVTLGEAAQILRWEQPPEIVLREGERVLTILTAHDLRQLLGEHPAEAPLRAIAPYPPAPLQANWPVLTLLRRLEKDEPAHYAVYQFDRLCGIIRRESIEETLRWLRWEQKHHRIQPQPVAEPITRFPEPAALPRWLRSD